jgi:hypothetical protein
MTDLLTCPFCKEEDFDLIGLKYHLLSYCEVFESTPLSHPSKINLQESEGK